MVPRPDIVALPVALTPTAAMEQVLQHPYTRYPVYDEEFDNVLGVLHAAAVRGPAERRGGQLRSAAAALSGPPGAETKRTSVTC
jgi:CBS domain containing-hemolysin-like protein